MYSRKIPHLKHRNIYSRKRKKKTTPSNLISKHSPLHFVTWNVLASFPQHYDYLKQQPPTVDIRPSLRHNAKRYDAILKHLTPHIQHLREGTLHAITLQEVDTPLLDRLREMVEDDDNNAIAETRIHVHTSIKPYIGGQRFHKIVDPKGQAPLIDFSYWLVTLARDCELRKECHRIPSPYGRFLTTHLTHCNVVNVHLPWVSEETDNFEEKNKKSIQTFSNIARLFGKKKHTNGYYARCLSNLPTFVIGDLNASCSLNNTLFDKFFPTQKKEYSRHVFGESYKLSTEHIEGRTTFEGIPTHGQDDGVIYSGRWTIVSIQAHSIQNYRLPVNKKGLFHSQLRPTPAWPSDHALVRFSLRCNDPIYNKK